VNLQTRAILEEQAVHRRLMQFGEHASLATPIWEARDTSVRAIAAHLATLWDPPARLDERGDPLVTEKGLPHARASVLNLIVTVARQPSRSTLGSARTAMRPTTAIGCATRRSS